MTCVLSEIDYCSDVYKSTHFFLVCACQAVNTIKTAGVETFDSAHLTWSTGS